MMWRGYDLTFPLEALFRPHGLEQDAEPSRERYAAALADHVTRLQLITHSRTLWGDLKVQQRLLATANRPHRGFSEGDLVLAINNTPPKGIPERFTTRFRGPYRVLEALPKDAYRLREVVRSDKSTDIICHVNRIAPFIEKIKSEADINPAYAITEMDRKQDLSSDPFDGSFQPPRSLEQTLQIAKQQMAQPSEEDQEVEMDDQDSKEPIEDPAESEPEPEEKKKQPACRKKRRSNLSSKSKKRKSTKPQTVDQLAEFYTVSFLDAWYPEGSRRFEDIELKVLWHGCDEFYVQQGTIPIADATPDIQVVAKLAADDKLRATDAQSSGPLVPGTHIRRVPNSKKKKRR
jgi:hypothetical protein